METAHRVIAALQSGASFRQICTEMFGMEPVDSSGKELSEDVMRRVVMSLLAELFSFPRRVRRDPIQSIDVVVSLLRESTKIVVIIGAGASVGPDFRSPGGLYDTIAKAGVLEDPHQVFDYDYFQQDPTVFWRFAHLIYPAIEPEHSLTHYFLAELEKRGKLLRVYSQNVDALEVGVPDEKLRCVHGSWRKSVCMACNQTYTIEDMRAAVDNQEVPVCKNCGARQIKPGIVFFGQKVDIDDKDIESDSENADLLLVIGTSMRVAPVSHLPEFMGNVPAVLINRESVTCSFNAELLGDCDEVVQALETELGWTEGDRRADAFSFTPPNKFVMPSKDGTGTHFVETGRNMFLVSPALAGLDESFD